MQGFTVMTYNSEVCEFCALVMKVDPFLNNFQNSSWYRIKIELLVTNPVRVAIGFLFVTFAKVFLSFFALFFFICFYKILHWSEF